ncbi:MAG: hypothetical protein NTX50_22885, partial [Candidatus Sumerlaeota bacterium]|nr:hypothetical protein [Candidatus Sumerlaeota bacterium]
GDKTGGFAYLKIPVQDQKAGYRIVFNIWGESYDPNSEDRTWLRWLRGKTGPKETDWIKYHFRRSEPLKVDRYNEIMFDFPPENLPIYGGSLFIGLGEGDQQIWVSKVELWYFGQAAPPKPE